MQQLARVLLILPALALPQAAGAQTGKGAASSPAAPTAPAKPTAGAPTTPSCPASLSGSAAGAALTCACPPATGPATGAVWGSGPYTADSTVCLAARHAGAVPAAGGTVTVRVVPGRSSYGGSSRNGITTMSYGSYGASFQFDGVPIASGPEECPSSMATQAAGGEPLTCSCPETAGASGAVWGSGPYTADSAVCVAARHAGAIREAGGTVVLRTLPGQQRYAGSSRNGVTTMSYGSYGASFEVRAAPAAGAASASGAAAGKPRP